MDEIQVKSPQIESDLVREAGSMAMFHFAHNFNISGGEFTNTVNFIGNRRRRSPRFKDFRNIRLGDLDLREEKQVEKTVGVVNRNRRRVYAARINGRKRPMTVTVYEGADVKQQWLEEVRKYEGLRLPTLAQVYGVVKSRQLYAIVYEDDLIPIDEFREWYSDSEIASCLLEYYVDLELDGCRRYLKARSSSGHGQTLWIRGSTKRLCLDLSETREDGREALTDGDGFSLHPPHLLSGKAQEALWMSAFELEDFHDVLARYSSSGVRPQISPYYFCRPGAILFLPDVDFDFIDPNFMPIMKPGGELAHMSGHQLHDSLWRSSYWQWDSESCAEMGGGWIRLWFPHIPPPCEYFMARTISLAATREETWNLETAWLCQAHHIFTSYGIKDDLYSYAFIQEMTYSISLLDSGHPSTQPTLPEGIFLFLSPIGAVHTGSLAGLAYPVPAYWSFEPSGSRGILPEDAVALGIPTLSVKAELLGWRRSTEIYQGLVEFHRSKGFNPDSPDIALHPGLPLYQVSLCDGAYPYVELVDEEA
ncbi:hypothetical protein C8R44DRAFT_804182 [Mycena epipterygia]|nr:hypothetical protein C8R44DRAFT_804182 [Mycena epipterygia]